MIVIAKQVGRLANRLVLFAHFIGAAAEHGFRIVNPSFAPYAKYFPVTAGDLLCRFPADARWPTISRFDREVLYRTTLRAADVLYFFQRRGHDTGLVRLRRDQSLDLDHPAFVAFVRRHRIVVAQDWFFRSAVDCEKHSALIRRYFTPWEHHLERVRAMVAPARQRNRLLIGVHVRQGDYATFKGGRYFFSHEQFRHVMQQIEKAFAGRPVTFLVCSDAPIPDGAFAGLDVLYGNGHELEDLYGLAACDRLMGPPSTYSTWASFYGAVPQYQMLDPARPVTPESFRGASCLLPDTLPSAAVVPG